MKITCSKSELLTGINIALRAVPSKSTLPILESLLITADNEITITSNDNDMAIKTIVEGVVTERGQIAVEARLFSEIIRKLPENDVYIEADFNYRIRITCEDSLFQVSGNNPDEFPDLPETGITKKISISEFTLKEMIRQTIFSIAGNEANELMKGELFSISGDNLKLVSLDGYRISIRNEKMAFSYEDSEVIVPGKTLNEIIKILNGNQDQIVELEFDKRFIKFHMKGTIVISRLIEGEFFNTYQYIKNGNERIFKKWFYSSGVEVIMSHAKEMVTIIEENKMDFMNRIDRAIILTREGDKKPVVLEIRDDFNMLGLRHNLHLPHGILKSLGDIKCFLLQGETGILQPREFQ